MKSEFPAAAVVPCVNARTLAAVAAVVVASLGRVIKVRGHRGGGGGVLRAHPRVKECIGRCDLKTVTSV